MHTYDDSGERSLEDAHTSNTSNRVGWFRFYFDEDHWEWSPEVEKMHGYAPGTVTPTTQLVLSHKHPDDYRHIADVIELIRQTRQALSTRHRIVDRNGDIHHVIVVGDQMYDDSGAVIGTHGFYVDVTPDEEVRQDQMAAAVAEFAENRAVIEQAKGMLMVIYGVDATSAFEVLRWRSQETNVKLRILAEQIVADFSGQMPAETLPHRSVYDNLLLTAHLRLTTNSSAGEA